ncbi:MAG: hypothetical protein K9H41_05940 [Bacteroidia bacterium]|nr:hypothetical protein [Bacteroidia bacterium]
MNQIISDIDIVLTRTEELVSNRKLLQILKRDIEYSDDVKIKMRLSKWLLFFNEAKINNFYIYSNTVYVLFDACNTNEIFKNQTEQEFEQSLSFYKSIISHPYLSRPIDFNNAKNIFAIALIYGKYGTMQINSFKNALENLKFEISENSLHDFFKSLLLKGEYPKLFPKNVTQFNEADLDVFMNVVKSNSCAKHELIPYELKNQALAIKYFFERMDIEMIDAFLSDEHTYQDVDKRTFISELSMVFNQFIDSGDSHLIAFEGACNSCIKGKFGYTFVGNVSSNYLSIIFDIKDDKIVDLYDCTKFKIRIGELELNQKFSINLFGL